MGSRTMRGWVGVAAVVLLAVAATTAADAPTAELTVEPDEGTVGQRLEAKIEVDLPPGATLDTTSIGPRLGPFSVYGGAWEGPFTQGESGSSWHWLAELSAFETGEHEIPAIRLGGRLEDGESFELVTEPLTVRVTSVLDANPGEESPEIADIKPPVAVPGNYRTLWIALGLVALLGVAAAVLWWLQHRYARRLAAVAVDEDAFARTPPHEWVYQELQRLLERRLPEQGQIDRFYGELSRILKRYLEGRFRVDLMEHTTEEVAPRLAQAGIAEVVGEKVVAFLRECDQVKFARLRPDEAAWREAIERVYAIVDTTKPSEPAADARQGAA